MRRLTVRLDKELEERLELAAKCAGVSKSELARRWLQEHLAEKDDLPDYPAGDARRAWELGKHLFGMYDSGRTDLSEKHEEILGEMFDEKRRRLQQKKEP